MSNFQLPRVTLFDTNGDPIVGGKIYFYEAGTDTPLDTYSDEELTTPNANPVVADASGRCGLIYLSGTEIYKVVVKSAADVTIYTADNIKGYDLENGLSLDPVKLIAVTPLDFGAIGDGVSDETTYVQQAINAATGTVSLAGKTFRCDTALTLKSNLRIVDGTLDFSNSATAILITATGTVASPLSLTANARTSLKEITIASTSTLSAYDLLLLSDLQSYSNGGVKNGEIVSVDSLTSTVITTSTSLSSSYLTASAASVQKISPIKNIVIQDVRFITNQSLATDRLLSFTLCSNVEISNVHVTGNGGEFLAFRGCHSVKITDCVCHGKQGLGRGFILSGSRLVSVKGCEFIDAGTYSWIASGSATYGVTRGVSITNCNMEGGRLWIYEGCSEVNMSSCSVNGASMIIESDECSVVGNTFALQPASEPFIDVNMKRTLAVATDGSGFPASVTRPQACVIANNSISFSHGAGIKVAKTLAGAVDYGNVSITGNTINGTTSFGIEVRTSATGNMKNIVVSNNNIYKCGSEGIGFFGTAGAIKQATISGNTIDSCTYGFYLDGDSDTDYGHIIVKGNTITNQSFGGITVTTANASPTGRMVVSDNIIYCEIIGLTFNGFDKSSITGNTFDNCTEGISASNFQDLNISGNVVTNPSSQCIVADTGDRLSVCGNVLVGGLQAIQIGTCGNMTINGNIASEQTDECIAIDTCNNSSISSNTLSGTNVDSVISVDSSDNLSITGNVIKDSGTATYGIYLVTCSELSIGNNNVSSCTDSVYASGCSTFSVSGNTIYGKTYASGVSGVHCVDCSDISICSNIIRRAFEGILIAAPTFDETFGTIISGNDIRTTGGQNIKVGIKIENGMSDFSISNNTIVDPFDSAILFDMLSNQDLDNGLVTGNLISGACSSSGAAGIYFDGTDTGTNTVEQIVISNNVIEMSGDVPCIKTDTCAISDLWILHNSLTDGNYAFQNTNPASTDFLMIAANMASSQSAGMVSGTTTYLKIRYHLNVAAEADTYPQLVNIQTYA